ncbi:MAG: hypothetical protein E7389_04475 [Ruminococcaceae bacterium]|jgi:hypothetical protein|nr:hypothetical protein [Oscillospiraceae bacterium]
MKKILLDENKNFYKTNMHCHSTFSDGNMTVSELKKHYMSNGYSAIVFSDHEHLIDNSDISDENFLAITGCEIAVKEFASLSALKKRDMKVAHFNFIAKEPSNIDTPCYNSVYDYYINDEIRSRIVHSCGEYEREYTGEGIRKIIKEANEKGFLVQYNHPRWSLENARDYLNYEGIWGVEIYNHGTDKAGLYEYDIGAYDDFLRDGQRIACTMGDDNHNIESTCGGYVMINAEKLEYGAIIDALEKHRFYASQGPKITSLYVEDGTACLKFSGGEYAVMSTKGRRVDKQLAKNPDGDSVVRFRLFEDDFYIRFDVVDKYGKRANTNAYFLDELK